ncbi:MAG TPA: hypothetical protein VKP13_13350 [Nitrospira sp.]|nr:hypothetical protein [Nitrospira sp.]
MVSIARGKMKPLLDQQNSESPGIIEVDNLGIDVILDGGLNAFGRFTRQEQI